MARATLRPKGQLTLPAEIRQALHVDEGDEIDLEVTQDGVVVMVALKTIPADQVWFWTEEWQAGEREASEHIAAGRTTAFATPEEMLAAIDRKGR